MRASSLLLGALGCVLGASELVLGVKTGLGKASPPYYTLPSDKREPRVLCGSAF